MNVLFGLVATYALMAAGRTINAFYQRETLSSLGAIADRRTSGFNAVDEVFYDSLVPADVVDDRRIGTMVLIDRLNVVRFRNGVSQVDSGDPILLKPDRTL